MTSVRLLIKNRQPKGPRFQLQVIDDQTTTLHVQNLHAGAESVYEDEHLAILHIAMHQVGHHPAKGIETLPHIRGIRVEIILHGCCQAEHTIQ